MSSTSEGHESSSVSTSPDGSRPSILCVDDEPAILSVFSRHLQGRYDVLTALNGSEGLKILMGRRSTEVVVADMQMPGMDGAAFLQKARQARPNTVRILITGQLDFSAAIASVNEAQIFRFLAKPCSQGALMAAADAAAAHHRVLDAERVLLEETLHGSIKILADVLALTNPVSFGRAMRIKQHVSRLAEQLDLKERWQVEVAAMLSQIGWITLPQETAEKLNEGSPLSDAEAAMVERLPTVVEQLLAHIPRLDVVRAIVAGQRTSHKRRERRKGGSDAQLIAWGAEILRVASDFDLLEGQGLGSAHALEIMRSREGQYDRSVLAAFASRQVIESSEEPVREMALLAVRVGMVLAEDVRMLNGTLLVARGYEVTDSFVEHVRNFAPGSVREPVRVTMGHKTKEYVR
jgi:response regulator RpfG family c-di-GMP phosphodiesterase